MAREGFDVGTNTLASWVKAGGELLGGPGGRTGADATCETLGALHGVRFSPPVAALAHPPLELHGPGTFAIFIQGGVQHGLWEV